jgi:hypothetical protein
MLTFAEATVRAVCADLNVALVEFNGGADHVHLLVAHPPTLALSVFAHVSKTAPHTNCDGNSMVSVFAPAYAAACGRRPFRRLLRRRTPFIIT